MHAEAVMPATKIMHQRFPQSITAVPARKSDAGATVSLHCSLMTVYVHGMLLEKEILACIAATD